jgi:hypothetical protein
MADTPHNSRKIIGSAGDATALALNAVPRSAEIDVDEAVKNLIVNLRRWRCFTIHTGVVESSIEPAKSLTARLIMAVT